MNALPGQLELATVIDHVGMESCITVNSQDTHKPAGVRLAKMLRQYDDSPSSQLWGDIQSVSAEILR